MNDKGKMNAVELSSAVAEKAAIAKDLISEVLSGVSLTLNPEKYTAYLDVIERFHWYSYINCLLILSQYPNARYLAGYKVWENTSLSTYNDPKRHVLKPSAVSKGIKLIAPFTYVNASSRSLINSVVSVFDVSQVNDVPYPENDFVDLSRCSYVDIINAINFVAPYRTVFASNEDELLSHNIKGYCNHQHRQFVIDSRLQVRGLLSVLLHEFAVAELYLRNYKVKELEGLIVESIFYILLKHFKLNTDVITFSYISRFKEFEGSVLSNAFYLIQSISHSIIERIEEHLEFIIDLKPISDDFGYQTSFDDFDFDCV